jgi:hypothetical protein
MDHFPSPPSPFQEHNLSNNEFIKSVCYLKRKTYPPRPAIPDKQAPKHTLATLADTGTVPRTFAPSLLPFPKIPTPQAQIPTEPKLENPQGSALCRSAARANAVSGEEVGWWKELPP